MLIGLHFITNKSVLFCQYTSLFSKFRVHLQFSLRKSSFEAFLLELSNKSDQANRSMPGKFILEFLIMFTHYYQKFLA